MGMALWRPGVQSRLGLGFETISKQGLAHTLHDSAEFFLSRRVKKGSAGRVVQFLIKSGFSRPFHFVSILL